MNASHRDDRVGRIVRTAAEIAEAVERLAAEIARDYAGRPLLLVGVLKGALYLTVDLARAISRQPGGPSELYVDYVSLSSYGQETQSSGRVRLLMQAATQVGGANVLIVEDIADNGFTLDFLQAFLQERGPASLRTCVLFDKPARRQVEVPLDYVGFRVPAAFVVGYGLDYQECYRNVPYLAELEAIDPSAPPERL